ncbi:hypothetical protein C8R46DRAFT_1241492 [Mycena filopes]|nr:hypothetical protein C8R46DRAFT_1241492 [Mycena filopes]
MAAPPIGLTPAEHDRDLYFQDGNLVLSANTSEGCTVYLRLHRGILERHSAVFADMLAMPSPPSLERYDGVPLVVMPDEAKALREFITLLYDPLCISSILEGENFTLRMLGPTQLAKKYQVDWICKLVASQLQKQWPSTIVGWSTIAKEEDETRWRADYKSWTPQFIEDASPRLRQLPEPVSSILLARECDVPSIIPLAFLHLLRFPLEQSDEGTDNPCIPDFYPWISPKRSLLLVSDWHRLAVARERIAKWFTGWGPNPSNPWKDCGSGKRCEAITYRTWFNIAADIGRDGNALKVSSWVAKEQGDICSDCKCKLRNDVFRLIAQFFNQLDYFFQLKDKEAVYQRDSILYSQYGDIVLSAQNAENQTIYFRLSKGILAQHSPVFSDMLAMPPPASVELYDGVPLVRLHDDADALRYFLFFLYDARLTSNMLNARDFPLQLLGPVRLAKKYQIDWILEMVGLQLEKSWPTSLEGWDSLATDESHHRWMDSLDLDPCDLLSSCDLSIAPRIFPEPVSSIHLARLCGVPTILPFAFFRLLSCPTPKEGDEARWASFNIPRKDLISREPDDWRRLFEAREKIGKWFSDQFSTTPSKPFTVKPCANDLRLPCQAKILSRWLSLSGHVGRNGNVLEAAQGHLTKLRPQLSNICPTCIYNFQARLRALRRNFVDELGYFFELEEEPVA